MSPVTAAQAVYGQIEKYHNVDSAVWIKVEPRETVSTAAKTLAAIDRTWFSARFDIPFSLKDSMDVQVVEIKLNPVDSLSFVPWIHLSMVWL